MINSPNKKPSKDYLPGDVGIHETQYPHAYLLSHKYNKGDDYAYAVNSNQATGIVQESKIMRPSSWGRQFKFYRFW